MASGDISDMVVWLNFYNNQDSVTSNKKPVHREKTNVPKEIAEVQGRELFKKKLLDYAGVSTLAAEKGLGRNINATLIRSQRRPAVHSVQGQSVSFESFAIRTQAQWELEKAKLDNNSFLQGRKTFRYLL